jgi:hypothetical protein
MSDPELPLRIARYLKDKKEIGKHYRRLMEGLDEAYGWDFDEVKATVTAGMKWGDVIMTDEGGFQCKPSGSVRRGEPEMFFGKDLQYIPIKEGETK